MFPIFWDSTCQGIKFRKEVAAAEQQHRSDGRAAMIISPPKAIIHYLVKSIELLVQGRVHSLRKIQLQSKKSTRIL
jgi:hypothetical protein